MKRLRTLYPNSQFGSTRPVDANLKPTGTMDSFAKKQSVASITPIKPGAAPPATASNTAANNKAPATGAADKKGAAAANANTPATAAGNKNAKTGAGGAANSGAGAYASNTASNTASAAASNTANAQNKKDDRKEKAASGKKPTNKNKPDDAKEEEEHGLTFEWNGQMCFMGNRSLASLNFHECKISMGGLESIASVVREQEMTSEAADVLLGADCSGLIRVVLTVGYSYFSIFLFEIRTNSFIII